MSLLTKLSLQRSTVTILVILMILVGGVLTYRNLRVELFPEIDFPLVTVTTSYPSANPEAVVRDVTRPVEKAILGMEGLQGVQSTSTEGRSLVLANFEFGTDMAAAEQAIQSSISSLQLPQGTSEPSVGRLDPGALPVLQLSVLGEREIPDLQDVVEQRILPAITEVDGVMSAEITGGRDRQVFITLDAKKLTAHGLSPFHVANALRSNNVQVPGGTITDQGRVFSVKIGHTYGSLDDLRNLPVAPAGQRAAPSGIPSRPSTGDSAPPSGNPGTAVRLSDVADVGLEAAGASSITRTNGKPSLGINVQKKPDANTVDVTGGVLDNLGELEGLPPDIEIVTLSNSGPEIQGQIDTLLREGLLGFLFAVAVVFAFLLSFRPGVIRGLSLALRPTIVIGLSIPLSILTGILLMGAAGMALNLMTLGGLAIAVGRVVDDSIVVLENVYRHIQRGEDRRAASLTATREVAGAITASTLTTIAVFVPLAFIQGLIGSFFLPFAITVTFALAASLFVALTAVPVLGALALRPEQPFLRNERDAGEEEERESWMQRVYTPALVWALRHKASVLVAALALILGSLGLMAFIPVTLFPEGSQRSVSITMAVPPGTPLGESLDQAARVENVLENLSDRGAVESYRTTIGGAGDTFGPGGSGGGFGAGGANLFVRLTEDAPADIAERLRSNLSSQVQMPITVEEVSSEGPPSSGLELTITGSDYDAIGRVARGLTTALASVDGVLNVQSDVTQARPEISISVRPEEAAGLGLTAQDVASQVAMYLSSQQVLEVELEGEPRAVLVRVRPEDVGSLEQIKALPLGGPGTSTTVQDVADVQISEGPVTISRTDGERSATITGTITAENTQQVNREVQEKIDAAGIPAGVDVSTGGIFEQIREGFRDIFYAIAAGVVLVYLVMVASLGGLRNPFAIILSLPLALVGALVALAVTGRALGLPAMMGLLLLTGIVVTNAIVLVVVVEQLREGGATLEEALVRGGRVRLRPILMTALTTSFALVPLATFVTDEGGIIGAELATVVIGGLISSTALTLVVVPVVYTLMHQSLPGLPARLRPALRGAGSPTSRDT